MGGKLVPSMLKQVAATACVCVFTAFLTWHVAVAYKNIQQREQDEVDAHYAKVRHNFDKVTSMLNEISQQEPLQSNQEYRSSPSSVALSAPESLKA